MKNRRSLMRLVFLALACAAGCDPIQVEQPPPFEVAELDLAERERLAAGAVEALESEEVYRPEFWVEGLELGSVQLGTWSCTPLPPPNNCTKLPCTGWFPSEPVYDP